jgi:hypothetical protein
MSENLARLGQPCTRICARMDPFLLAIRESKDFAKKRRFSIVKSLFIETKSDALKSLIWDS